MKTNTVKWYGKNTLLMFSFPPKRKKTFHLEKRSIVIMIVITSIYLLVQQKINFNTTNYTYQVAKREPMNEWSITYQLTDKAHHLILQQ